MEEIAIPGVVRCIEEAENPAGVAGRSGYIVGDGGRGRARGEELAGGEEKRVRSGGAGRHRGPGGGKGEEEEEEEGGGEDDEYSGL